MCAPQQSAHQPYPPAQQPYQPAHQPYQPGQQPYPAQQHSYSVQQPYNLQAPQTAYAPMPQQPQQQQHAASNLEGEDEKSGRVSYFFFGLALSILLDTFAFLFLCCSLNVGITPSRRKPFIWGIVVGILVKWIIFGVLFALFLNKVLVY